MPRMLSRMQGASCVVVSRAGVVVFDEWAVSPYRAGVDVDYPGFGRIVIRGKQLDHDVVVEAGRVRRRKKGPSKRYRDQFGHTPLSPDEEIAARSS